MRIFVFFTLILGLSWSLPIFAENTKSFSGQVEDKFEGAISKIVKLNREVKMNPKNIIIEEIYKRRNTYTKYAKSLYKYLEIRSSLKPTVDVSDRYKLSLQKYLLSCEIAALRMVVEVLSSKYISEEDIMREIPQFVAPYKNGIWGDPEKEFVGSYTGSQKIATGYGVYGLPLSRFLDRRGYNNQYSHTLMSSGITGDIQLSGALDALKKGDHIIFWGDWCTTPAFDDGVVDKIDMYVFRNFTISGRNECERASAERVMTWKTKEGTSVSGISGEHAFLLLGYVGSKENPTHIIVWDTDTGKHIYPILEWMRKWSTLDYRMLIVENNSMYRNKK
ncbi:MAG: hypothetical protein HHAS10_09180 [Candidatus Altimarinota bacterium]